MPKESGQVSRFYPVLVYHMKVRANQRVSANNDKKGRHAGLNRFGDN